MIEELNAKIEANDDRRTNPAKPRSSFGKVRALDTGTSKMQAKSKRNEVFQAIKAHGEEGVTVEELDEEVGVKTTTFLSKLVRHGHIEVIERKTKEPVDEELADKKARRAARVAAR